MSGQNHSHGHGALPGSTSLAFFSSASAPQWAFLLSQYKDILRLHAHKSRGFRKNGPEELIKLDNWFHDTLPGNIQARRDKHVTHEELVQITKWKLTRGKNRRQLLDLVRINTELAVKQTTQKAFRKIPNLAAAISALTTLKGIGPQTASAVLCAGFPDHCPYMADECMLSVPGVEATDYTLNEFNTYATQIKTCVDKLQEQDPETRWTPHKVEMALWVHYLAKELKPSLLQNMPLPDGTARGTVAGLEEEISNTSEGDIVSGNGNGHNNGRHSSALDEDSNISVPASTGSASGDDSKLSNADEDSRQSGEFRTPFAAGNNSTGSNNHSGNNNHHHHLSNNSNESSAESLSNASEPVSNPSSVADDTSQGSGSAPGNGNMVHQNGSAVSPAAPVSCPMSLVHEAEEANHVVPTSCGAALPLSPVTSSLEEPALKKIRASE